MSWWLDKSPFRQERGGDDREVEQLQADVMRFMAILGLILTIIFALVQSLPFRASERTSDTGQTAAVQARLTGLQAQIEATTQRLGQLRDRLSQAHVERQQLLEQIDTLQSRRHKVLQEITFLQAQLQDSQHEVAKLAHETRKQRVSFFSIQNRTEQAKKRLEKLQLRLSSLERKTRQSEQPPLARAATATPQPEKGPNPKPSRQTPVKSSRSSHQVGFSLKFESDAVLDQLVSRHSVDFYVIFQDKAWRVELEQFKPRFVKTRLPGAFHEMASDTVPEKYRQGFQLYKRPSPVKHVTWAVVLPPRIIRAVNALMRGRTGGDIIIREDASVLFAKPAS